VDGSDELNCENVTSVAAGEEEAKLNVVHPDPELDPNPVRYETLSRIRKNQSGFKKNRFLFSKQIPVAICNIP
jgi:hypothetical protein